MPVISNGRERDEPEYRELLDAAGLRITKIVPTLSPLASSRPCAAKAEWPREEADCGFASINATGVSSLLTSCAGLS